MKEEVFNQIIEETPERERHMAKLYPYFSMYQSMKLGKYKDLPVGTIIFCVLSYILTEGKLKDRGVSFKSLQQYLDNLLYRLTDKKFTDEELKELSEYLFNKFTNDGDRFTYEYYNYETKSYDKSIIQYISASLDKNNSSEYMLYITTEGIEFLLGTKEVAEEHKISIYLLLLQKMIKNNNLDDILRTIINLNTEIKRQIEEKQDLLEILLYSPEDKFEKYKEYKDKAINILKDEEGMFKNTKKQVSIYQEDILKNLSKKDLTGEEKQRVLTMLKKVNIELDKCISNHNMLMKETVNLINELPNIQQARLMKIFKETFMFEEKRNAIVKLDDMSLLKYLVEPLFKPHIRKQFSISKIDEMFSYKEKKLKEEEREVNLEEEVGEVYTIDREAEDRIQDNHTFYMRALLTLLSENNQITLREYIAYLIDKYGEKTVRNKDMISFIFEFLPKKEGVRKFDYKVIELDNKRRGIEKIYVDVIEDLRLDIFMEEKLYTIPVADKRDVVELGDYLFITNVKIGVIN